MKISNKTIVELITVLGFKLQDDEKNIYYKKFPEHSNYVLKVNFESEKIEYGGKIKLGDLTTSNFENSENFVVLECVHRLLSKGYDPSHLVLENKWPMGRKEKGKLDVLVLDKTGKVFLMIECKTWGEEHEKEKKKMLRDGGQLFSYYLQDKAAQYLCLYASRLKNEEIQYINDIVKVDEAWHELSNQKEIFDHWNKNFKDNGVFEDWANAYDVEIKALTRARLKELTEEDSGRIFNQFAEILRHNIVSDKPNAFNKIFNLFLCKIVDEDRSQDEELLFQWREDDSDEMLQNRLNDLYKKGMREYLTKEVTDYSNTDVADKLISLDPERRDEILRMFSNLRLRKNPEFAFKEVFDEKSFIENAVVIREVIELLQPFQIRYGHKQQFLGDFFELLLSTGLKQEAGQFFTPVPIAKFIVSSLPIRELILEKIKNKETHFLPYMIDYAAGSGHFLTEAMDEVQNIIDGIEPKDQRPSVNAKLKSWNESPFDWAYEYIYGIEADYRLVKTAKVSCFLNGDGLANVIHADGLDNFIKSKEFKGKLKKVVNGNSKDNGQFDILIANPPYSVSAFKNNLKDGSESFELYDRLTDTSSEIECLFIERTKQLLKVGGWAGVILPSSILTNTGIYTDARELLLKYFFIKSIAEFGSNTFMATGTNTVTLFLERRPNSDHQNIQATIENFFSKPVKDININNIEKAITQYVLTVFNKLSFEDYISFLQKAPNKSVQNHEIFKNYQQWFEGLSEIKNLKDKKEFKSKSKTEQSEELKKIFYEKVLGREKDKMLYFFLSYPQKFFLIKVGEKQGEKDFIGYEFSNRRGHEGIRMYRDENGQPTTKLYEDGNPHNPEKANTYIYNQFLGNELPVSENLSRNINLISLKDCLDFSSKEFLKIINLTKKKEKFISKYMSERLGTLCEIKIGGTPSRFNDDFYRNGKNLWVSVSELNDGIITDTKEKLTDLGVKKSNVKLVKIGTTLLSFKLSIGKTAIAGKELYTNEAIAALEVREKYKNDLLDNYLFSIFSARLIDLSGDGFKSFGKSLNSTYLNEIQIPLPPANIQKDILRELKGVEEKKSKTRKQLESLGNEIESLLKISGRTEHYKFSEIATLEYGKPLPKSKRKPGDYLVMGSNGSDGTHNNYLIKGPCIIVGRKGSAGKINYVLKDCYPIDTTFYVKYDKNKVHLKYLYLLLCELDLESLAKGKGIGVPGLNRNIVHELNISIHKPKDQIEIVAKMEKFELLAKVQKSNLANISLETGMILRSYLQE